MARIIVTAEAGHEGSRTASGGEIPILLDERVDSIHLSDDHASEQLVERLAWAVIDAEQAERELAGARA